MLEFFRRHTWLLQIVLAFVVLAFVAGGVYQGYGSMMRDEDSTVAKVDGGKVSRAEWEAAQRQQVERVRQQMPNVDAKLFDTPEMKQRSLDAVIRERVLLAAADHQHLAVSDARLQRLFATDPQFESLRNPDGSVNREQLARLGMSSEQFAQRLRQDMALQQVEGGLTQSALAPAASADAALDAMFQQREVQVQNFVAKDYLAQVTPTDAQIQAFYQDPAHAASFMVPERESIEYVVLDLDAIKQGITVSDKDLRDYYTSNQARYAQPEERRASHILIKAPAEMPAAERAQAKARAEAIAAEVRAAPATFADVARRRSDDPASATRGGDLDFSPRGGLGAKALDDAIFAAKPNEIVGPVESEFGYHVIQLNAVRGGTPRPFEAVRAQVEDEVRAQLATKRFAEAAGEFTNTVYEQPDSLKPVADKYKLPIQTAADVTRAPAPGAKGALANAKFLGALFGADAVQKKRNTEAVEVGASTLASGRVVKHEAARRSTLEEARARIREQLVADGAAALARQAAEKRLAELRANPATAIAAAPVLISRAQSRGLPPPVIDAAMKTPTATLPAFTLADLAGGTGVAVVAVKKVAGRDPMIGDATRARGEYAQTWGEAEARAYYEALKGRYRVEMKPGVVGAAASASGSGG